jgi:hypothetical protein
MRLDPVALAPVTLAASLAGALVLTATLGAPAYAEAEEGAAAAWAATASPAPASAADPSLSPHRSAGDIDRAFGAVTDSR